VKGEDGIRKENPVKKGVRAINRDIAVFAFFLLLAFIFWYLNSLSKEAEVGIRYQVRFTNIPKNRVITENLQAGLDLFLKGPGYSILKLKISGRKAPVIIDISKVNYKRATGGKTQNYYIVTSGLTKSLNVQMRSGCEITSIKPDTLFFTLEKTIAKSFAVPENKVDNRRKR
jgi:hypothetical protein